MKSLNPLKFITLLTLLIGLVTKSYGQVTFADNFTTQEYDRNDGNTPWSTDWIEFGDGGSPLFGNIFIFIGDVGLGPNNLAFAGNSGINQGISRTADLTGATAATLMFDWQTQGLDFNGGVPAEELEIAISNNGGATFTVLNPGTIVGTGTGSENIDISAFISGNTVIRFEILDTFGTGFEDFEFAIIDNLIINATIPTTPQISITNTTVNEADGTATLTIAHTGETTTGNFTVPFTISNILDTATLTNDYTIPALPTSPLTFTGTSLSSQTITFPIVNDNLFEPTETFRVNLGTPSNTSVNVADDEGIVTINDNDTAPSISINDRVVDESDPNAQFTVTFTGDNIPGGFTINFSTTNQTATAGADYATTVGTLTFPESATAGTQTITVPIIQSVLPEITETFQVNLTTTFTGIIITDNQGIGTIIDNDDIDDDGITDNADLDNDNDGIPNCVEDGTVNSGISDLFTINGNAAQLSPLEARITPNLNSQAGAITINNRVDFRVSFNFEFNAFLGNNDGGADGVAIIFHNDPAGASAVGAPGNGLGARGIQNGIVLELDTFFNGDNGTNGFGSDFSSVFEADHGTIWRSVDQVNLSTPIALPNLENNAEHLVNLVWDANTTTLSYFVDGTLAGSYTDDLVTNIFGDNLVFFGFSGSTGGFSNEHRIRFDDLCDIPLFIDNDNDGIPNYLDLDSDNDGILDVVEGGNGNLDTNNDGRVDDTFPDSSPVDGQADISVDPIEDPNSDTDTIPDYLDPDSDNDGCLDAIEAEGGFTIANIDAITNPALPQLSGSQDINGIPLVVSPNGQVFNSAVVTVATTTLNSQPISLLTTAGSNESFSVSVTANGPVIYQWQQRLSINDPWTDITNGGTNPIFSGATTDTLNLNIIPLTLNGSQYRVIYTNRNNLCVDTFSDIATLTVRVGTVITNRRITYRVRP